MAPKPALELSSDERGDAELVQAEVVDFIDDYCNYEDEGETEILPYLCL